MLSPEKLLSFPPLLALKTMISEQWINSIPDWFVIKGMVGEENFPEVIVTAGLSNLHVPLSKRSIYKESFEYVFTRINIGILNNKGPLLIKLSSIKSKPTLVDALEYLYKSKGNIVFDATDFVNPTVELMPGELTVKASAGSYRWYGTLSLMISVVKESIDKYLVRRECIMDHTLYFNASTLKSEIVSSLNKQNVGLLQVLVSDEWCRLVPETMSVIGNESDQLNTRIKVIFDSISSPYDGEIYVDYGRKSFYKTYGYPITIPSSVTGSANTLSFLNAKLGTDMTTVDVTIPSIRPVGKHPIHLKEDSLTYVGTVWVNYE